MKIILKIGRNNIETTITEINKALFITNEYGTVMISNSNGIWDALDVTINENEFSKIQRSNTSDRTTHMVKK